MAGAEVATAAALAALPVGSVVRLASGQVFVRVDAFRDGMDWQAPGDTDYWGPAAVLAEHPDATARVLYDPATERMRQRVRESRGMTSAEIVERQKRERRERAEEAAQQIRGA